VHEALAQSYAPESNRRPKPSKPRRELGVLEWRQYLKFTTFEGSIYFDEGNGGPVLKSR